MVLIQWISWQIFKITIPLEEEPKAKSKRPKAESLFFIMIALSFGL
jgi:hypothetical protein